MSFENHIFISYAHVDNKEMPGVDGWITRFHKSLESYLSHNLGGDAMIWRDEKLNGTDIFGNTIVNQFPKTAVLVSVLSERYLKSEWCLKEVNEFCRVAGGAQPGLVVDDKARVVKVMLKPIPADQRALLPPIMQEALGYEFYEEVEGQRTLLLDPAFGEEYGQAYRRKIYFLADDVAELVKKLEEAKQAPNTATHRALVNGKHAASRPTIYLAECGYDRWEDREKIHGELREHGYAILPEQRLPDLEQDYIDEVNRLLDQCDLAIHLIGEGDGGRPAGPGLQSAVALQHALALEKSKTDGLPRVIWLAQETTGRDERHQAFIKALREDSALHFKADLIAGNLEELKREILNTLKKQEEPEASSGQESTEAAGKKVYLICDAKDLELPDLGLLLGFLSDQEVEITWPVFDGDAAEVSEANEAQIKSCDAVILFFGAGDGAWKRAQESEIKRVQGLRIDKPLLARFTYLAGAATPDKKMLKLTQKNGLIDGLDGFSEALMAPFLDALKP